MKEIALLFLMHGDVLKLEIPLFGEGSGIDLTHVPAETVKHDAQKLVVALSITMVEAVEFIRTVSERKFLKHSVEAYRASLEDSECLV